MAEGPKLLSDKRIRAVIAVAAPVWAAMLLAQGVHVDVSFLKPFSGVVGLTILALGLYDRRLWRWSFLRRLQKQPILQGTWRGVLQTSWADPTTGVIPGPIDIFMVVRQTASTISFSMLTKDSASWTKSAAVDNAESGSWVLSGTYLNTPQTLLQHRSRVHRGSAVMEVHTGPSTIIEGSYWTDRDTKGSLRFTDHNDQLVTHFELAQALFQP